MEESTLKIVAVLSFIAVAVYHIWYTYFRKCTKCGGKIRLDEVKDSMGHNITKTITITFWKGPRKYTETFKCQSCGATETHKSWSWD